MHNSLCIRLLLSQFLMGKLLNYPLNMLNLPSEFIQLLEPLGYLWLWVMDREVVADIRFLAHSRLLFYPIDMELFRCPLPPNKVLTSRRLTRSFHSYLFQRGFHAHSAEQIHIFRLLTLARIRMVGVRIPILAQHVKRRASECL